MVLLAGRVVLSVPLPRRPLRCLCALWPRCLGRRASCRCLVLWQSSTCRRDWAKWRKRGLYTTLLLVFFVLLILSGVRAAHGLVEVSCITSHSSSHFQEGWLTVLIIMLEMKCYHEIVSIGYLAAKELELRWFRTINWCA